MQGMLQLFSCLTPKLPQHEAAALLSMLCAETAWNPLCPFTWTHIFPASPFPHPDHGPGLSPGQPTEFWFPDP